MVSHVSALAKYIPNNFGRRESNYDGDFFDVKIELSQSPEKKKKKEGASVQGKVAKRDNENFDADVQQTNILMVGCVTSWNSFNPEAAIDTY